MWVPLYADEANDAAHLVLRIPFNEGCLLNSKEKAPYCIFVEALALEGGEAAIKGVELPEKMDERFEHRRTSQKRTSEEAGCGEGGREVSLKGSKEDLTHFDSILMRREEQPAVAAPLSRLAREKRR